jgi:hypothetical protein
VDTCAEDFGQHLKIRVLSFTGDKPNKLQNSISFPKCYIGNKVFRFEWFVLCVSPMSYQTIADIVYLGINWRFTRTGVSQEQNVFFGRRRSFYPQQDDWNKKQDLEIGRVLFKRFGKSYLSLEWQQIHRSPPITDRPNRVTCYTAPNVFNYTAFYFSNWLKITLIPIKNWW